MSKLKTMAKLGFYFFLIKGLLWLLLLYTGLEVFF